MDNQTEVFEATQAEPVAVIRHEPPALPMAQERTSPTAVFDLLRMAIEKNIPVEALEKLQALHERVSDRQAAAEFAESLATFQRTCPPIAKNATATVATRSGGSFQYGFADLPEIALTIAPHLKAVGLTYTWDSTVDQGKLTTTCHLRHINGHRESASFTCPVESGAGMSEQQKYAAALSFGRRMSLISVLGLTTTEAERIPVDPTPITEDEAADIEAKAEELGINKPKLLKFLKVESFATIPAARKLDALAAIEDYRQKKGAK